MERKKEDGGSRESFVGAREEDGGGETQEGNIKGRRTKGEGWEMQNCRRDQRCTGEKQRGGEGANKNEKGGEQRARK